MAKLKDNIKARYFGHDCNARNDEKLVSLRMDHGASGYGIYFMLLERLGECADYKSKNDARLISFEIRESEELIKSVIEDYDLFKFTNDNRFYSQSFLDRMSIKDRDAVNGIKGNLIRYGYVSKEDIKSMSDEEILTFNKDVKSGKAKKISGGDSGAISGGDRNKVKKSKVNKEGNEKSNESNTRALDFLKNNYPSRFETDFVMRYGKNIENKQKFTDDFNDTIDQEDLEWTDKKLFARLGKYSRNWIDNQNKFAKQNTTTNDVDNFYKNIPTG